MLLYTRIKKIIYHNKYYLVSNIWFLTYYLLILDDDSLFIYGSCQCECDDIIIIMVLLSVSTK